MLNRIIKLIRTVIVSLSFGLKYTEEDILRQKANSLSANNSSEQKLQQNQLAESLLRGEVTEEVEILRDRTYFVSQESKKYSVIIDTVGTSKAFKKLNKLNIPKVYNSDDCEIKLIVDNYPIPTSVTEGLSSIGGYGIKDIYPLEFSYEYLPKFKIEQYTKKLVIRTNEINVYLDLYVPEYSDSFERMEKIFDTEINNVILGKKKPIDLEFKTIELITNKSFGAEDLCKFKFEMVKLISISKYDRRNVLTYTVNIIENGAKITDKYKNEKLRKNYEEKASRNQALDLTSNKKEISKCDKCGCNMESEYDYRITKSSIGIGLCKKCLEEYYQKNKDLEFKKH